MANDESIYMPCEAEKTKQAPVRTKARSPRSAPRRAQGAAVHLCFPDDQLAHFPEGKSDVPRWPLGVPAPRQGEVIYLTSASAWAVSLVIHELVFGGGVRTEIWLEWIGASRHRREAECTFVQ